ncbi:sugar nucleotide-binding protein [Streptomyces sp. NPDC014676]|uniref:sugar nucleotide-binding protein n=1 Tax=Streptomyces sp. NPDC014676 TaxID=3364879 RepID=UPI0036F8A2F9
MKALVLSGGAGIRPGPIIHTPAGRLVPVADGPVLFHEPESPEDAGTTDAGTVVGDTAAETEDTVGGGSESCPRAARIPRGDPPRPARAALTAPTVRHPAGLCAGARRTAVQGHRKDTAVAPLEAGRRPRAPLASGVPRGTVLDALTRAGTFDVPELGHFRTESAHGDGLPAPTRHRAQGRPAGPRTARGRFEPAGGRTVPREPPGAGAAVRTPWLHGLHGTNFVRTMIGSESRRPTVDALDDRRIRPATGAALPRPAALPPSAKSCPSERNVSRCRSGQW